MGFHDLVREGYVSLRRNKMSKPFYPGQVNSPTTTLTAPFTVGDTIISLAEVGTTIFPAADNICVIGTGIDAVTYIYTGKSVATGAGNLTGVTVLEGTPKSWAAGETAARNFTKYDQDSLAPIQQYAQITLMPGGSIVPTTNPAVLDQAETSTNKNNYIYGKFTAAGEGVENLQWLVDFPEDWAPADATLGLISVKFIWLALAGANDVKWQIAGKLLPDSDPIDVALPAIGSVEDTVLTTGDMQVTVATTAALVTSVGGGGQTALFKVTRIAPAGTDNTSDIYLIGVRIKFIRTVVAAP
jgi:hypothetical protein